MQMNPINKDTILCLSLAARPSNFGTSFHNYLYQQLGLDYIYKAVNPGALEDAVRGIRGLRIRGCGVSMPFKEEVIPMLDKLDPSAARIGSVNTIVNEDGILTGYNTDYQAVYGLIKEAGLPANSKVAVLGSGGMAKAVVCALHELGFSNVEIFARNRDTGSALAKRYNYEWCPSFEDREFKFLVNITPIGMAPLKETEPRDDQLPFPQAAIEKAEAVMDVVANPPETQLVRTAMAHEKRVITGYQIIVMQATKQFVLYTGDTPDPGLVDQAGEFARKRI